MTDPAPVPPVNSPDDAVPASPAVGPGPIGGEATVAASSWGGATDEEMEDLRRSEHEAEQSKPA